ncbi:DUF4157 domain-containing protein [Streptomyces violascens]|uniref:eCIS core domain-containing protein n=1 Tax=Streptomyces violascens TaxID=67381 RepID=UPI0036BA272E
MHANDQARISEGKNPARSAAKAPARGGAMPAGFPALQSTAGNAAVVQMLRAAGHSWAQEQHRHGAGCGHRQTEHAAQSALQRSAVHDVLRSGGRPLDEVTRTDMESRLGADFSDVRIHNDSAAKASAAEVGARAYTSGNHVVIGNGGGDDHTLAHELTHVIQQRQGPVAGTDNGSGLKVSDPSDRFEREAEANATRAMRGEGATGGTVQRAAGATPNSRSTVVSEASVQRVKSALFAAKPESGRIRSNNEEDPDREYPIGSVAVADTHSTQGEHVFNAVNALALEMAAVLETHFNTNRPEDMGPELATSVTDSIEALRAQARALGLSRDNHQYRAAPAGMGNPANATSYSQYVQQVRRAVGQATGGTNPVLGWSMLVDLSRQVLDRAVDQTARSAQARTLGQGFTTWFDTTSTHMENTFTALLTAVSTVRTAIASSRSTTTG